MMSAQPNPTCVRDVAFYLGAMSRAEAEAGMRLLLNGLRNGLIDRGWPRADADDFALAFGEAVIRAIRNTPMGSC